MLVQTSPDCGSFYNCIDPYKASETNVLVPAYGLNMDKFVASVFAKMHSRVSRRENLNGYSFKPKRVFV